MARVLVVDDEPDILSLVSVLLHGEGHEVTQAANVGEARAALEAGSRPDLILLDWMLPDEPGTALLREIRRDIDPSKRAIAVVMLTAKALIADKQQAEMLGANGYMVKPIRLDDLRALVASLDASG